MLSNFLLLFVPPDRLLMDKIRRVRPLSVSIFGAGDLGVSLVSKLAEEKIKIVNWYDSSVLDSECMYYGYTVRKSSDIATETENVLVLATLVYVREMLTHCDSCNFTGNVIHL